MADYEKSLHNVAIHFCDALIPRGQKPERMEKNGREVVFFPIPPRWKAVIKPEAAAQSLNIYYRQTKKRKRGVYRVGLLPGNIAA